MTAQILQIISIYVTEDHERTALIIVLLFQIAVDSVQSLYVLIHNSFFPETRQCIDDITTLYLIVISLVTVIQ